MKAIFPILLLGGALAGGASLAAPAAWWTWASKVDGARVCAQTPLGPGWDRVAGPFRDSGCQRRR